MSTKDCLQDIWNKLAPIVQKFETLIFFLLQRQMISGLTAGAVKEQKEKKCYAPSLAQSALERLRFSGWWLSPAF